MTDLPRVLVVDDEPRSLETLTRVLGEEFLVLTAGDAQAAEAEMERGDVQVILCDQRMPGRTGVDFLSEVRRRWPDPVRMIISGYSDSEDIIDGVNDAGIYRYITKPWDPPELVDTVRHAVGLYHLQRDTHNASVEMKQAAEPLRRTLRAKKRALKERFDFSHIVRAEDSPLNEACRLAGKAAGYDVSVLITGESGTGKELMARGIHYQSVRADRPFVIENCGALPDELLESELFGCKKGAFTGAYADRIGLFQQADGGTIFLDEIGETSPAFQVKLLRVLQEGEIRPLGSQETRRVNVRVISATNRDLRDEVRQGRFRRDLFYRLAAFPIHMLPLRDRPMDIPLMAERILGDTLRGFDLPDTGLSADALAVFSAYSWPGNVREMQNEIQRMVVLANGGDLGPDLMSAEIRTAVGGNGEHRPDREPRGGTLKERVELLERRTIAEALARHGGNISRVADETGLSRVGLRNKMHRYGLGNGGLGTGDTGDGEQP